MQLSKCCINLSGLTLGNDKILDFITRRLDETGIAAEKICFEITETAAATSDAHHIKDAADCNEVIEHHCKDMDEAATEKCLVDWHEHHAKEAAHELDNHKECVDLILELEHEPH